MSSDQAQCSEWALDGCAPRKAGDYLTGSPAENSLYTGADPQTLQAVQTDFCCFSNFYSSPFSVPQILMPELRPFSSVGSLHLADLAFWT